MKHVTRRTRDVGEAAAVVRGGGLVAFPTETVYGLGADGTDAAAVRAIFVAKGRPSDNPLILHVGDVGGARSVALWNPRAEALAARHWPGPLTLVLPARETVPIEVRAGLPTVAVRCPAHPLALALLREVGRPIAAPSANRSGRPSATSADAVWEELAGRIDAVLDGGVCPLGVESTVVDCSSEGLRLLRLGALAAETLGLDPAPEADAPVASPGMRHPHYAPAVELHLTVDLSGALARCADAAVLCTRDTADALALVQGPRVHVLADRPAARCAELYAALRRLERSGAPCIVAEAIPARGLDAAFMDRLRRAAAASACPVPVDPQAGKPPGRVWPAGGA